MLDEKTRAWIYRILTPVGALLVFYGVFTADEAALWITLGGVALVAEGGLAIANTSTKSSL